VPLNNYLLPGSARNIYWKVDGPAQTELQMRAGLAYAGDPTIGREFIPSLQPFGTAPSDPGIWYLLGASSPGFSNNSAQFFFVGQIDPKFTGGKRIGYVRIFTNILADPFNFMLSADFNPPGFPVTFRTNYEALIRVIAPAFQYLNDLGIQQQDSIININGNFGGTFTIPSVIASFFGGTRKQDDPRVYLNADSGFSPTINALNFQTANDSYNRSVVIPFNQINTDLTAQYYPGSVFKNGRLFIMTDLQAYSGADRFPHLFLGDNLDKNIGNGVSVKIFGEISGRQLGFTGAIYQPTVSKNNYRLQQSDGSPVPPYQLRVENAGIGVIKLQAEPTTLVNVVPQLKLDSDASGTFPPGPWNDDFENTIYPDYGFIAPIYPPLPGDTRAAPNTNPANRALFRHIWLEVVIRNCLLP
jgi:hypothetical protein